MKKIIAAAVATAFVAPVMAADVTISGLSEFYYKDSNGATSTGFDDHALYFGAATETNTGLSVSVDMNITGQGGDDSSDSINVSGPFGTIELGDTSGAADKYDDRIDKDVVIGTIGTSGSDAGISWALPALAEGLSVYLSHSADALDYGDGDVAHTGVAIQYSAGPVTVAYGDNQADTDSNNETYVGGTVTFGGVAVSAEQMTLGASGSESKQRGLGLTYSMGDVTFAYSTQENKNTSDVVTDDLTFMGVKYDMGGGVTAFVETSSDSKTASEDVTAAGIAIAF